MSAMSTGGTAGGMGVTVPGADRVVWYFLRVSGLALVVLAGVHMAITHFINVPTDTTFEFVANRWANPLWRAFDWLLLISALWHGVLGLRYSIADYLRSPGLRVAGMALMWVVGVVFMAIGSITIFTFDAEMARNNLGPLSGEMWIAETIGVMLYLIAAGTYIGIAAAVIWVGRSLMRGGLPVYSGDPGQYAWVFHRATGIGILFFLLIHIVDIMLVGLGRDVYDHSVEFYGRAELIPMEIALVGAVIYHTLNGLRVIAIDFTSWGYRKERQMFYWALVLTTALTLWSGWILIAAH
jgi:succinate dehydrogenase / fumarate reductase, membrane anchor subunit